MTGTPLRGAFYKRTTLSSQPPETRTKPAISGTWPHPPLLNQGMPPNEREAAVRNRMRANKAQAKPSHRPPSVERAGSCPIEPITTW